MESHFELRIGSICFVGWFVLSRCLITVYQTLLIGLRLEMKLRANDASLSCVAAQSTLMGVLRVCVHVSDGI